MGAIILTLAVVATVIMDLDGILKVLNKIGPIIIVTILAIAVISTLRPVEPFQSGLLKIDSGNYEIAQVGNNNPVASGVSYAGFVILWFAPFISEIGSQNKLGDVNKGMLLSAVAIFGTATICCIALIANIDITWNVGIPALALAKKINPLFAVFFAIIIFLGIYTTAVPLLWAGIKKLSDITCFASKYKLITVCMGMIECLTSCFFPYKGLLNFLYGLNGYMGFLLIVFMVVHDVKRLIKMNL